MKRPKICVPIMGVNIDELKREAELVKIAKPDIVEWRCDYYSDIVTNHLSALKEITGQLKGYPIIFTLRSDNEGGAVFIPQEVRQQIMQEAIESSLISYIDIERANGSDFINPLVNIANKHNVKTIISNHNFKKTPSVQEIVNILTESGAFGADLVKIAVMPKSYEDVLTLLNASLEYKGKKNSLPAITISMGKIGIMSRVCAGLFGSEITFASLASASAPGQIPVEGLKKAMEYIY